MNKKPKKVLVNVEVWRTVDDMWNANEIIGKDDGAAADGLSAQPGYITSYVMDHNNAAERGRLGEGCRDAFLAGQCVVTWRDKK